MSKSDQNRFFKILNDAADRRYKEEDVYQYDPIEEDRSSYGKAAFQSEMMDVETTPERTAVAPYLKNPEKESVEFVMVLAGMLLDEPKLIDTLAKNKMKLSSELIPDPEAKKPFRSENTTEWEKAIKSYIIKQEKTNTLAARAAQAKRAQRA